MGLLRSLFALVIFFFLFGEVIRIPISGLSIKLIDIGVAILAFYWVLFIVNNKKKIRIDKRLSTPILIFFAVALLSLIFNAMFLKSDELFVSALYLIRWIAYASIAFIIPMFNSSFKKKIKNMLVLVGIFVVVLGYIQYFLYPNLRNLYYLGWDEHLFRMFSVFLDPNFAGAFFVLYFLFLLNLIFKNSKNNKLQLIYCALAMPTLISVFLTYSRSALIMLTVGIVVFLIMKKKSVYILSVILVFTGITFILPKAYKTEGTNFLRITSSEARIGSAKQALGLFWDNPVFGVGFNTYRYAKNRHGFTFGNWEESHADAGTDNSFLFILATTGVTGFVTYLFMWFKILKINARSKVLIASIVALFVDSLFINSLFYSFLMFWIWSLVGLLSADRQVTESK